MTMTTVSDKGEKDGWREGGRERERERKRETEREKERGERVIEVRSQLQRARQGD